MRTLIPVVLLLGGGAFSGRPPVRAAQAQQDVAGARACGPSASPLTRTTLYFGLSHRSGMVTQTQWQRFLRQEVTPRFPEGLTVWEADGQWRRSDGTIARERAKVLLLVHEGTPAVQTALSGVVESYKRAFQQQSVLWESAPVCAAF